MYMSDYDEFWKELFPSEGERFLQQARIILSDKVLAEYCKKVGGISIMDTYLYRDIGIMYINTYDRLLPHLESACQYEQRRKIQEQRQLQHPPEGIQERRSHKNPRPSDVVQMIINKHMYTILDEQNQRIERIGELVKQERLRQEGLRKQRLEQEKLGQESEEDLVETYRVEVV